MRILILVFTLLLLSGCNPPELLLTADEQMFIRTNRQVRVAIEEKFPPFIEYKNHSEAAGLSIEYLDLISKKTGLEFVQVGHCQFLECLRWVDTNLVDLVTTIRRTPERVRKYGMTNQYMSVPTVMIFRIQEPKTVGIGRGYSIKEYFDERPEIHVIEFSDDEEAILSMIDGQIDAIATAAPTATHLIRKYRLDNHVLPIAFEYSFSFATQHDNITLVSILNKAIFSLTEEEIARINYVWE